MVVAPHISSMSRHYQRYLCLTLHLLCGLELSAAGPLYPYLLKDIATGERKQSPRLNHWAATLGEVVFFGVAEHEIGLWRTDGTAAGTHRIYDGVPHRHVDVQLPAKWNDVLYYPVISDAGVWLHRTDGTTPGTNEVAKISGWHGGAPCGDGKLCFATTGSRVAVTDGTAAGTSELLSTASDYETNRRREMTPLGKRVFFNAYDDQNGLCMRVPSGFGERQVCGELWTSDGTLRGTHLFKDLLPGGAPGAPEHLLATSSGRLYFAAADPQNPKRAQAWVSDGTAEGTLPISPKSSDWSEAPRFTEIAGRVFFSTSDGDLFETNGTPAGTRSIRDLFVSRDFILSAIVDVDGKILLWAGYHGRPELWSLEGTTLTKLADIPTALRYLGRLQSTGFAYFVSDGGEMWSTDGTAPGTRPRFTVRATGATMYGVAVTPTRLYYGEGYNRYVTDGTKTGTHQIDLNVPVPNGLQVVDGEVVNGKYYFVTSTLTGASDGTAEGTSILLEDRGFKPFAHEGHTYFYQDGTLWKTDGTIPGTFQARGWLGVDYPRPPAFIGTSAIFAEVSVPGRVLRRDADGALHELGVTGRGYSRFVSAAGGVAFWVSEPLRLMFTDGTPSGTQAVTSEVRGGGNLMPLGAKALFAAKTEADAQQLWVTDFTSAGTQPVKEIPGSNNELTPLFKWRNLSIFSVGPFTNVGVWRSDGTAEGTFELAGGWFDAVLADGDELVFVRFANTGYEVWTSDGTLAGTIKRDIYAESAQAGEPFVMAGGGVGVIYRVHPGEVHIRNHRTKAVHVIHTGGIRWFGGGVGNGNLVIFNGYRRSSGFELWAVRLDEPTPSPLSSVAIEYRGIAQTRAGTGAVFQLTVDARGAKLPSVVATTVDGTLRSERDYIPFTREIVFEDDHHVTLVVPLRHSDKRGSLHVVLSAPLHATITNGVATASVGVNARRRAVRQ